MTPPKKKPKMSDIKRSPNCVSFEHFKRLIENLADICFEVKRDGAAGDGHKTLDECALWYYQSFYTDPEVRQKYPYKLKACPQKIREKFLSMPEPETVSAPEPVAQPEVTDGVMVKVSRMGTFIFPVTFFAFKSWVNVEQVLRVMGKTKEERQALLADEKECYGILKRFYNTFYMFPDRPSTEIFKNVSPLFLTQLLKNGRAIDEMAKKSMEKHAAEKNRQSIVSFELFEKNLANIYDIVWQLKLNDRNYVALDFEKCAQALYLAFYLKLEIRDKYTFKWRPCSSSLRKRLLAIPDEEAADELRRSMPHLYSQTPEMETQEEFIEIDDLQLEKPGPVADYRRKTPEESNNNLEKQSDASDQVVILQGVAYEYPVTLNCFLQFVNQDELLSHIRDTNEAQVARVSDKELMHCFYISFYTIEKFRKCFKCSFKSAPPALSKKLLAMAKPVTPEANVTIDTPPKEGEPYKEHVTSSEEPPRLSHEESSQGSEEEPFQTDVELNLGQSAGRFLYPVSFDTFRRCINYAEIIRPVLMMTVQNESHLAALIPHPLNPLCEKIFRRYYRSFYVKPDVRQRYPYRFSCADSHVLEKLIEYAKPLDEKAVKTLADAAEKCEEAPQSKTDPAKGEEAVTSPILALKSQNPDQLERECIKETEKRETINPGDKENTEKPRNTQLPVTFHRFKRYVRNFNEILKKMQLCDEFKKKSEAQLAEEYYKGFYTSPEMRRKYECKFRPCPAKTRDLLLSYAQKPQPEESSQESDCDVEFVPELGLENGNNVEEKGSKEAGSTLTRVPVEESKDNANKKETVNPVSLQIFKRYVSNLQEIIQKMLLCDEHKGKSEEECARDYYRGFYSSQEIRDRFPYQLKACPAKMKNKLVSFPPKERKEHPMEDKNQSSGTSPEKQCAPVGISCEKDEEIILMSDSEDVEMPPSEIPVHTEESSPQNKSSSNCQQTELALNPKSKEKTSGVNIRTLRNGSSFEFPVDFETFKRHINYDEIIISLLKADSSNESEQPAKRGNRLFRQFFCSFYIQKDVRDSHPYRFEGADSALLEKLEEYAVPLNEVARQTMSDQPLSKPLESLPMDKTLVTLAGITYRFPVPFKTFHQFINYDELKEGLIKGAGPKNKSTEELAKILGDETSCLRQLRSYYYSFYTRKMVRNKLKYNFNAAPPELVDKLLEFAKPIDESAETANQPQQDPQPQPKQGVPNVDKLLEFAKPIEEARQTMSDQPLSKPPEIPCAPVTLACVNNARETKENEATTLTNIPEEPKRAQLEERKDTTKDQKSKETPVNPVSLQIFKRYVSNLQEIVKKMLLCDEHKGKSEEECARDYYRGFYSSQEIRDRFPYQLKACPAKMRNKLVSFPPKEREEHPMEHKNQSSGSSPEKQCAPVGISSEKDEEIILMSDSEDVEMPPSEIPVHTEESSPQNKTSSNCQQTELALNPKSREKTSYVNIRTLRNGSSFEFPVDFETFKRHINYDEIINSLLKADSSNESEQPAKRGKRLFRQFFCSFYIQKDVRDSHPYRFEGTDSELLKKLQEYAVPLNEVARQTMSDQQLSKPPDSKAESWTVPHVPKDETRVTLAGITYRFPVSFKTFHQYINYDELKEGLIKGAGLSKSPEELKKILGDETSCLRQLRRYYYSFYTKKIVRNKLKYNFNAAPPELVDKLLELAEPIDAYAETANQPQQGPESQPKQGVPNVPVKVATDQPPVIFNVFLDLMYLEDVVRGMQQEPEYSRMSEDECKLLYYKEFYSNPSIRDKYPYKLRPCRAELRDRLLMLPVTSTNLPAEISHSVDRDLNDLHASREAELEGKQWINVVTYRPSVLRQYIADRIACPAKQALLERHILDSIKTINATDNSINCSTVSIEESLESMSKNTDPVDEAKTSASDKKTISSSCREKDAGDETPAEACREPRKLESANNPKSSADIPGTSTSSSTFRVTEETQDKRKENGLRKGSELEEKTNSASNKNEEYPAVTKKVTEVSSTKENESQKSAEQVLVSKEKATGSTTKESDVENATNETPAETDRNLTVRDSANKPKSKPNNAPKSSDVQEPRTSSNAQNPAETKDKRDAATKEGTGNNSGASSDSASSPNTSQRQTEQQIMLEQAKKVFFAEISEDHNMPYLICSSQALKTAIWRILYQLSLEEFKTYTSIHDGEDLYRSDEDLQPYYQHVVDNGNWPINLYVRLPMLRQLLHSKGMQLGKLDLVQLSPKMLHWRELDEHTDFDKIVEMQYEERTGKEIDSVEQWFDERDEFYAACWRHDQWIYEVPRITNEALHDEACVGELPLPDLDGIVLKPLPFVEIGDVNSQTEIISIESSSDMVPDSQSCPPTQLTTSSGGSQTEITSIASSSDMVPDSPSCPPTQLNSSNFLDIASVDIHSQVPQTQFDPLATQTEHGEQTVTSVKQEPIKFLNNLRGICHSDECHWERITSEEQIIDLDLSQEEGPSLSCFAIPKPSEMISPYQSLGSLLTGTMFEDDESGEIIECLPEHSIHVQGAGEPEEPALQAEDPAVELEEPEELASQPEEPTVQPAVPETIVIQPHVLQAKIPLPNAATRKKKLPASHAVPTKRARLGNEKVPQLRHEFRPLPLNACVRIETETLWTDDPPTEAPGNSAISQPEVPPTEAQPEDLATITPSQDFALGNTLLQSSQLDALLDAIPPNVTVRKVIEKEPVNKHLRTVTAPAPSVAYSPLRRNAIFRKLERFIFFAPLTVQHISKYMIEGYCQGATYQSALLKIDGRLCRVRGSLLGPLFPHLSPLLRSDLERVLCDLPEFVYSCRWRRVLQDNTEDLRKRVLYALMDTAPEFGQFRMQLEDASREWATCEIGRWDAEVVEPRPRCSNVVEKIIRPSILEKMREFKELMS